MAEFQEVARHWKRMCNKYWNPITCHGCPIAEHERCYEACSNTDVDISIMEKDIMSWAAEHSEPVYPTWWEWLENIGIVSKAKSESSKFFDTTRMYDNIPADIAQKLGIESRE